MKNCRRESMLPVCTHLAQTSGTHHLCTNYVIHCFLWNVRYITMVISACVRLHRLGLFLFLFGGFHVIESMRTQILFRTVGIDDELCNYSIVHFCKFIQRPVHPPPLLLKTKQNTKYFLKIRGFYIYCKQFSNSNAILHFY